MEDLTPGSFLECPQCHTPCEIIGRENVPGMDEGEFFVVFSVLCVNDHHFRGLLDDIFHDMFVEHRRSLRHADVSPDDLIGFEEFGGFLD